MNHVDVIGGGIAGLSAAYYLQKKAAGRGQELAVTVLEAGDFWGGKITTERVEGFVIEGGPDTFLATKPWGVGLCRELGLEGRLHGTNPHQKNTYVLHRGRLRPLPDGLTMMIPTQFGPMVRTGLLSWPAKARMGLDFFIPARRDDEEESLGAFVTRRLGRSAYEHLIEPLMSGIYAGNGDHLSLLSTFPYLRELEVQYGGLVKGALVTRKKMAQAAAGRAPQPSAPRTRQGAQGSRSMFLTTTTGLAELVEALVARLEEGGASLRLSSPVRRLLSNEVATANPQHQKTARQQYLVALESNETIRADGLILAAPAYASGWILAGIDPSLSTELCAIEYVSTATVSLAYRVEDLPRPLDGYGYVIPRREGRRALACTWTSTKFPHRAPEGYALLRVFIGRAGQEDQIPWDEPGLVELARQELQETLGITAEPALTRTFIWERAMPQYNLGHPARLERIETALERWPALALAGNGYRGIGLPDCIHSGELAAERVLSQL
jgi:oxygen-dependent protoporphyrinogen oxidase